MSYEKVVIGIDIGETNTELGVVNFDGKIYAKTSFSTNFTDNFQEFMDVLADKINYHLNQFSEKFKIHGIGVGAPNANFYKGTIENPPNLLFKGVLPFTEMLTKATGYRVVLTNDANAAAIGEGIYGGAQKMKHFVVITLGTGLGSGIVCNGKLIYGHDGFAGEAGHMIVDANSKRLCGCGNYGCLETYASATGIVKTAISLLQMSNEYSLLREILPEKITSYDIYIAAVKNDIIALQTFDKTVKVLAISLANLTALLSPEAFFISGGVIKSGEILFKPLQLYYDMYVMPLFKGKTKILPSQLSESNTGLMGAAALAFNELT